MGLVRLLLVVLLALSASVSAAMVASHTAVVGHNHTAMDNATDKQPACCSESTDRTQTCHVLPALLPGADRHDAALATCEDLAIGVGLILTGVEPSVPLYPPRAVRCIPHLLGRGFQICNHI